MDEGQKKILELNRAAEDFFRDCLKDPDNEKAAESLRMLGIKPETAERYGLGFAPKSKNWMIIKLAIEGWPRELMEAASLVCPAADGRSVASAFCNMLMFPVRDAAGNVLGFMGRSISGEEDWKATPCMFGPESKLFSFGHASKSGKDRIILVGNPLDAVLLNQEGFGETVALIGFPSVTPEQAELMAGIANNVAVVTFPRSGFFMKPPTEKSIAILKNAGLNVKSLELRGEDPMTFIRTRGADAFSQLLEE